jgi:hypothetical protein
MFTHWQKVIESPGRKYDGLASYQNLEFGNILLTSPIPGPPKTLTISLELPPSRKRLSTETRVLRAGQDFLTVTNGYYTEKE